MRHGLADGSIVATSSIGYYEGVTTWMGGRKQTEDFFRLFLVPGVHHCGGGPGLTEFDALTASSAGSAKTAWFKDSEGNILVVSQRVSS
jgi:hypothetical protein